MGMVFCRGCGKEIHDSAPTCPHCGAPQGTVDNKIRSSSKSYTNYSDVPWFRKNWFAIVCFFIFSPALLFILPTGDVYYEKKGELKTYSKGTKIFIFVWIALSIFVVLAK